MPADFVVPDATAAFWAPWDMRTSYRGARFPNGPPREARFLRVVGRMTAGMSVDGATARMQTLAAGLASEHPDTNAGWSVRLSPLADEVVRTSRLELVLVFAAMFCLLLLVSANVASLAIARGVSRAREIAIRLALGAGGSRVTRQLIAESAFGAIATVIIAIVLTAWWVDAALSIAPAGIPRLQEVAMNARVASFALCPRAPRHRRRKRRSDLPRQPHTDRRSAQGRRAGVGGATGRLHAGLVVAEIAAAVMLLVGAGLLARTFAELRRVDVGFGTSNLLVLRITPDAARYRTGAQTDDYYRRVLNSLREVPAPRSVAAVTSLPMSAIGSDFTRPYWPERPVPRATRWRKPASAWRRPDTSARLGLP